MSIQENESAAFEVIRSNAMIHTYTSNIEIFRQGQLIQDVFLLDQGNVKMTYTGNNGNETIVEINAPVRILGVTSVLCQAPATVTATTLTTCCIRSLPTKLFLTLIEQESGLTKALLKLISKYSCEQVTRQAQLATTSSRHRLASILLDHLSSSIPGKEGKIRINLPFKKADIAALLAVRPEQVSRLLAELKNKGIIEEERGWIIVSNLKALIGEAEAK